MTNVRCSSFKIQAHAMFLDTSFNSLNTVLCNIYQNFLVTATRFYHYLKCLPSSRQPKTSLLMGTTFQRHHSHAPYQRYVSDEFVYNQKPLQTLSIWPSTSLRASTDPHPYNLTNAPSADNRSSGQYRFPPPNILDHECNSSQCFVLADSAHTGWHQWPSATCWAGSKVGIVKSTLSSMG